MELIKVAAKETGTLIQFCRTTKEAFDLIKRFEDVDMHEEIYEEGFYEAIPFVYENETPTVQKEACKYYIAQLILNQTERVILKKFGPIRTADPNDYKIQIHQGLDVLAQAVNKPLIVERTMLTTLSTGRDCTLEYRSFDYQGFKFFECKEVE